MSVLVTKEAPDFTAKAVLANNDIKEISLSSYRGKYVVLFFYPMDFTFVCPTEILAFNKKLNEFEKRDCQVIGVSTDSEFSHLAWKNTLVNNGGIGNIQYPIVADISKEIAEAYDVLFDKSVALRGLFLIDKEGIVRHQTVNDLPLGRNIDEALTTGKADIQITSREQIQSLLDTFKAGIQVVTVQLQGVNPPEQVAGAFKDVVSAREDKERMINEAQGYKNAVIPEARGQAAQILREAEAYREEKIKRAEGDAKRFLSQYEEYKKAPDITRKRIYLETMEEIMPTINKFIMGDQKQGVLPILPLSKNPILSGSNK